MFEFASIGAQVGRAGARRPRADPAMRRTGDRTFDPAGFAGVGRIKVLLIGQSFLDAPSTHFPGSFLWYFFSTAPQATRWARLSSWPYWSQALLYASL